MAHIDGVFVDGIEVGESKDDESLRSTIKNLLGSILKFFFIFSCFVLSSISS
jgi:hypothetical protein